MPHMLKRCLSTLLPAFALAFAAAVAPVAAEEAPPNPEDAQEKVRQVTGELVALLHSVHENDDVEINEEMRKQVIAIVEPHLDFVTMTRLAVGRHWREADNDQKRALVREFRELLVRTYSMAIDGLDEYYVEEFRFQPLRESPHQDRVEVRSHIIQRGGPEIPVNFGLRYTRGDWMLYDIVIDGVSLVTTYRSGFSSIVAREGVDGLIADLEKKNRRGEAEVPEIDT